MKANTAGHLPQQPEGFLSGVLNISVQSDLPFHFVSLMLETAPLPW